MTAERRLPERARVLLPAVVTVLCGGASLAVSWQRWINPFVDGGRELNVPARIAAGERLYRDIAYNYGPLAPWANALAMRFLGRSFLALELVGVGLSAVVLVLLYAVTLRAGGSRAAFLAASLTAALCVGGLPGAGFVFPYSFANLYALGATLLAALGLVDERRRQGRVLLFSGLSLALLARPEYGIGMSVIALLALRMASERLSGETRAAWITVGSAWGVAAIVYGLLLRGLGSSGAVLGGPLLFLRPPAEWRALYRSVAGVSAPHRVVGKVLLSTGIGLGIVGAAFGWSRLTDRRHSVAVRFAMRLVWGAGALAIAAALGVAAASPHAPVPPGPLVDLLLPVPSAAMLAAGFLLLFRPPASLPKFVLFSITALWGARVAFSLTLGSRMNPFDGPAIPCAIASLVVAVFRATKDSQEPRDHFRGNLVAILCAIAVFSLVRLGSRSLNDHAVPVRTPAGTIRLLPAEAAAVARTLDFLSSVRPSGIASFPEGGFFPFVTGAANPLRQEQILPGTLTDAVENEIVARIRRMRPVVLVIDRPTREFGKTGFGRDYARTLWGTIETNYRFGFSTIADSGTAAVGSGPFFVHGYLPRGGR